MLNRLPSRSCRRIRATARLSLAAPILIGRGQISRSPGRLCVGAWGSNAFGCTHDRRHARTTGRIKVTAFERGVTMADMLRCPASTISISRAPTCSNASMRNGNEKWLLDGAEGCFSLYGARVGLIGFGDLARAFVPLLAPFGCPIKAYDPWVSDHFMAGFGVASASLEEVLEDKPGDRRVRRRDQREPGLPGQARVRDDRAWLGVPADEPGGRGRFPRVPAAGRERAVSRRDRRLSARARAARRAERARSRACCCRRIAPAR